MPTKAKRTVSTTVTPVSAKPAKPGSKRAIALASVAAIPPVAPVAPVSVPAVAPATDAAPMPRGLTRDAAGIVRGATFFNTYSDRDSAYLAFFGSVARANSGSATLRQIHDAGSVRSGDPATSRKRYNPNYSGSGKATDIGAVNRLIKAGYFTRSADGNTITATALALGSSIYLGTKQA